MDGFDHYGPNVKVQTVGPLPECLRSLLQENHDSVQEPVELYGNARPFDPCWHLVIGVQFGALAALVTYA